MRTGDASSTAGSVAADGHTDSTATPRRLAVMLITRNRPEELRRSLGALGRARIPAGIAVTWIVVDNATPAEEAGIRATAAAAGLDLDYCQEPVRGYASPRNRALERAIAAGADFFLFIDDDVAAEPDLIAAHIAGLDTSGADVSMGGQTGRDIGKARPFRRMKVATFNVMFRRALVAEPMGLRFDERLNLTGFEDHEFFYEAQRRGARVLRNGDAKVALADSGRSVTQKSMTDEQVAVYFYATGRNLAWLRRVRNGRLVAWGTAAHMLTTFAARTLINVPLSRISTKAKRHVVQDTAYMRGLVHGLMKPGVERVAAKRGEIVEIGSRGEPLVGGS